ncbi:MAG: TIGR02444 family protein [Pseudohongiella sp.]|nr:TIGR02444 family protein [Pseudohongiella sp.]
MMEIKTFAVAVYSIAGVAQACLTLQDRNNVDVPLLLFCGWYGASYGRLSQQQLSQATEMSQQLGAYLINPLRGARRWMKTNRLISDNSGVDASDNVTGEQAWDSLREQIKSAELKAELLLLDALASTVIAEKCQDHPFLLQATVSDIQHNLDMLATGGDKELLALIIAACSDTAQLRNF